MSDVTVKRWRRYGKDRVYVNAADGARLGWLDVPSGEVVVEDEDARGVVEAAVSGYRAAGPSIDASSAPVQGAASREPTSSPDADLISAPLADTAAPTRPPASTADDGEAGSLPAGDGVEDPEPYAIRVEWRDLARNQAGQAARTQAVAERRAAPVRTLAARLLGQHTDERAWRIGADGEEQIAARLDRLPDTWSCLHALPVGSRGADIDHLVVGPAGVFTINTKHHPDAKVWVGGSTFLVNGHRQPYVRNSRHEAARASRLLSQATGMDVEVRAVIALVGVHKGLTIKTQPDGVHVVGRRGLVPWLERLPAELSPDETAAILTAARRSDTWQ